MAGQAAAYADPLAHAGTALVLAAGNVASLGPRDVLSKLFVEGKVVVMKANPVNDYLVPYWRRALAALLDAGVLRIVDGGAAVGQYLTGHARIDEVHITGSDKTYDAVVFGTGPEGARRKAADEPVLDKPVTAELGSVSPVIVVPGRWSIPELLYQAEHVATMLVNNAGFNCVSARLVVTHAAWPQREAFLGALTQTLNEITTRRAYYPGAGDRRDAFVAAHPEAEEYGRGPDDALPWTFIRGVPPGQTGDICFNVESFFGQVAETALTAPSPAAFVDAATAFCNDVVWGTLGRDHHRQPLLVEGPRRGRERRPGRGRPALRLHRGERLARAVVRHGLDELGGVSGAHPHRHPVGDRRGRQRRDVRPAAEVGRARAVPVPAQAAVVRHRATTPTTSCAGSLPSRPNRRRRRSRGCCSPPCGTDGGRHRRRPALTAADGSVRQRGDYIVLARTCGIA